MDRADLACVSCTMHSHAHWTLRICLQGCGSPYTFLLLRTSVSASFMHGACSCPEETKLMTGNEITAHRIVSGSQPAVLCSPLKGVISCGQNNVEICQFMPPKPRVLFERYRKAYSARFTLCLHSIRTTSNKTPQSYYLCLMHAEHSPMARQRCRAAQAVHYLAFLVVFFFCKRSWGVPTK